MAAVIDLRTGSAVAPRPGARERRPQARPQLTLLEGGRSASSLQQRRVYRRRRAAVLVLLVAAVGLAGMAGASIIGQAGGAPSSVESVVVHRVQPGDTLWGVATAVDPQSDPRQVVDRIVELNSAASGGTDGLSSNEPLRVGQELRVPARSS